jgi:hypothetical protein
MIKVVAQYSTGIIDRAYRGLICWCLRLFSLLHWDNTRTLRLADWPDEVLRAPMNKLEFKKIVRGGAS